MGILNYSLHAHILTTEKYVMKRFLCAVMLVFAVIVISGCKLDVTQEVYSSELRDVALNATSGLMIPMKMAIEIPSTQDCDEYKADVSEVLKGLFHSFSPKGCEKVETDSWLIVDTQIPLTHNEETWHELDSLFGLLSEPEILGDNIFVLAMLNLDKYALLNRRMNDKFFQSINLTDSKIIVILNNDERESLYFHTVGVFVNNYPENQGIWHSLNRSQRVEIRLSNVGAGSLARVGSARVFVLENKTE